jgi:Ca-activated chloride channel homolog
MVSERRAQQLSRWVAAAFLLIVVVVTVVGARSNKSAPAPAAGQGVPNANCVGVVVVSSQEKADLLAQLAALYDQTKPTQDGICVDVRVNSMASGKAEQALARDWASAKDGPAPTVWSPAASSWLGILSAERASRDLSIVLRKDNPSLMQSPLVLAMPRPMGEVLGWPNTPVGWADVLKLAQDPQGWGRYGHPEWGPFGLGKTSPAVSTSGLHALLATYYAATGLSADLTAADVQDPKVVAFVKAVESSVLHYGNTVSTFFDGLRAADLKGAALTYVSAIATEEKQVLDYNATKPATPLVAVYPKDGTMIADHPFAILEASWVKPDQKTAAATFLNWLLAPEQQKRFLAAGFRDHSGNAASTLGQESGIIQAGPPVVLKPPAPAILALVRKSWDLVRKHARILIVIDVSGSMQGSKLDEVKAAGAAALETFSPEDQIGLWTFSDGINRLDPIAPLASIHDKLDSDIKALAAGGGTALYKATAQAVAYVQAGWDTSHINAVLLLTDGQNSGFDNDGALVRSLSAQPSRTFVPVFTIAYGGDADVGTLKRISAASHGLFYNAPDPTQIGAVFIDVISNF